MTGPLTGEPALPDTAAPGTPQPPAQSQRHHPPPDGRYTPGLAFPVLTPLYDVVVWLLGFGTTFKAGVAEEAAVRPGERVLDLGCGTGTLLAELARSQPQAELTGVDPDPAMLERAARRLAGTPRSVRLLCAGAQHLPLPDDGVDVVISTLVFHHLPDPVKDAAVGEVRRVLTSGGRFLLVDFGPPRDAVTRGVVRLGSLFDGRANMLAHLAGELPSLLSRHGFTVSAARPPGRAVHHLLAVAGG